MTSAPDPANVASDLFAVDTLAPDASLPEALRRRGLSDGEVDRVERLLAPHRRGGRYGPALRVVSSPAGGVDALELVLGPARLLRVRRTGGHVWDREIVRVPPVTDTVFVTGRLAPEAHYAGRRRSDRLRDPREAINRVARRLATDPELRSGDGYHAIVERDVGADGAPLEVRVLAVRFQGLEGPVTGLRMAGAERPEWVDAAGRPLSAALIPPTAFPRVTSDFDRGRFHPVLKRRIPHLGVDFGAWYSTPVRAAAAGKVTYRGWFGGHGRMVEITHPDGRRTRYSHLLRYRRGLGVGDRVAQGEIIAVVGSSGLADGPHLHFALIEDGEYLDPMEDMALPVPGATAEGSALASRTLTLAGGGAAAGAPSEAPREDGPREDGASRTTFPPTPSPGRARLLRLLDEAEATVAPGSWALARVTGDEADPSS